MVWEQLQSTFLKSQNLLGYFMQSLSFQSHNLVVDYISFKFQELDNYTQTKIANYLFKIGFNSYQESERLAKPVKRPIGKALHFTFLDLTLQFFTVLSNKN
jgi:hypothetical protein